MGKLYLVATPIGNLEDISARALRILRESSLIAAEDTRHTKILLNHFGIQAQLVSYFEHNKLQRLDFILEQLAQGDVALVSDAGTPAINDPGYELIQAALASGFEVSPVPGPSALISALIASGLPTDSFLYLGYLPHKSGERRKAISHVADLTYTLLFLESTHRIADSLRDLFETLGDRRVCVAREMTKRYEEFWRGTLSGAAEHYASNEARGEFTLVIAGRDKDETHIWGEDELRSAIQTELDAHKSAKEISAQLSERSGWTKKDVYALVNSMK